MVFKDTQANFEAALATFVIGDLNRKSERSNQGSEVKTSTAQCPIFSRMNTVDSLPVLTFFNSQSE